MENEMLWVRSQGGNLSNETVTYSGQTDNIDYHFMRGKVSDPYFDTEFAFSTHSKERASYYSSRLRQLESTCSFIVQPNDMTHYFPSSAKSQLNSNENYLFKAIVYYFNIFDEYAENNSSNIRSAVVQYQIFEENSTLNLEFNKNRLSESFQLTIPLIQEQCYNEDLYHLECRIWDNNRKQWTGDNIELISIDKSKAQVTCATKQLGFFAVEEVEILKDRAFKENYGVYAVFSLLFIAIAFVLLKQIFSNSHIQQESGESQSQQGPDLTPKQLIFTIDPIFSIFYSQSLYQMILKIALFCNLYFTIFAVNALLI
eukprot:TRINITY_DN4878_c0_g1_i6.p1 TRINITY_DN4878_c0_g1~~TRINITY_DN4878_c0_g1_i6.p1  ORF type:complete len:314 (-),score=47.97 TRINITY_DN4878_c0_g1_i6:751-1692(-)